MRSTLISLIHYHAHQSLYGGKKRHLCYTSFFVVHSHYIKEYLMK